MTKKMLSDLEIAVEKILQGELVAFPTETVYGLGADATNYLACEKIFALKGRPNFNPLIVHVSSLDDAKKYAEFSDKAELIAEKFWPGPLTMVLKINKDSNISQIVTASLDTIAIRCPAHPIALELIKQTARPIAAPSANKSGFVSPTCYDHVRKNFKENLHILDGGKCTYGLESTIIDLSDPNKSKILRHGFIDEIILSKILDEELSFESSMSVIKAPGSLQKHYSTKTPIRINAENASKDEVAINFAQSNLFGARDFNLSTIGDLREAAANLYNILVIADEIAIDSNLKSIVIAPIPEKALGIAINDKLRRASFK